MSHPVLLHCPPSDSNYVIECQAVGGYDEDSGLQLAGAVGVVGEGLLLEGQLEV